MPPGNCSSVYVVSNRLSVTVRLAEDGTYRILPSSGGLVSALKGLSDSTEFIWYGWPGLEIPEENREDVRRQLREHNAIPTFLEKDLADKHYNGFSNKILWPLLHYQVHEIHMSKLDWEGYQDVNRTFCNSLVSELQDGDIVWVHDYHLLLLPSYLREVLQSDKRKVKIGLFLHTVFPSSDFFRILPVRKDILTGLLSCDVIGFHTREYADNFLQSCRKIMGLTTAGSQVLCGNRAVKVLSCPIGIDPGEFPNILSNFTVKARMEALKEKYRNVQLIISVDRLDYIKGIPLRIAAIDTLLTNNPECIGKVVLLQILVPSREGVKDYRSLHTQIDNSISRVNGKYGNVEITPIQSLFSAIPKSELAALYAVSDVCVVSSTRDGLNLVSFEYIACQQERRGVLVLSEFAGAADMLDGSLQFNPWDVDEFADTMYKALRMDKTERENRWERLWGWVSVNTAKKWSKTFLEALGTSKDNNQLALERTWKSFKTRGDIEKDKST
ncbi:glycosyltransferase family 20 protein [Paecilomyces variotii No. 5]|uniref:Glycosyltransferase family 20 protein n=1 Tax=Byssochlamys spectabilis (strain No. 5 / NBRC 109023) TaxID=1356009 RepID=V5FZI2_BYSSN|nr:glycosyltransferase family 20 protein [Paecilomyces variotii No. 5]